MPRQRKHRDAAARAKAYRERRKSGPLRLVPTAGKRDAPAPKRDAPAGEVPASVRKWPAAVAEWARWSHRVPPHLAGLLERCALAFAAAETGDLKAAREHRLACNTLAAHAAAEPDRGREPTDFERFLDAGRKTRPK